MSTPSAESFIVNERPLTDDTLTLAPRGYVFPGQYVAILTFHTLESSQSDVTHVRRFRTMEACERFIVKRYGRTWRELAHDNH